MDFAAHNREVDPLEDLMIGFRDWGHVQVADDEVLFAHWGRLLLDMGSGLRGWTGRSVGYGDGRCARSFG